MFTMKTLGIMLCVVSWSAGVAAQAGAPMSPPAPATRAEAPQTPAPAEPPAPAAAALAAPAAGEASQEADVEISAESPPAEAEPSLPPPAAAAATVLDTSGHADRAARAEPSARTAAPPTAANSSGLSRASYPLTPGVTAADYPDAFVLSGYAQAQYEAHQDSEDQQQQGGALLNRDRFLVRRGRIKVTRDWEWGQVQLELDGNTVRGPALRVQQAEVSLLYGRKADKTQPPLVQLTAGQFDLPFGFEMTYTAKSRWFMERSTGLRALFPGEPDVGVRVSGGIGFARYSVAVTNGEPLDERSGFGLQDPNKNKDITARFGAEAALTESAVLAGGVSFNRGRGLHPGTDASKGGLSWRDMNENGAVDTGEVFGVPASAAVPAKSFERWAMGVDLELLLHTKLGWSMLSAEAYAASNLDRGLLVADPVVGGADLREVGYYVAFTQEITRYGLVGFRYDYYDPNTDFLDKRAGKLIPTSQRVRTIAPLIGLTLPDHARLAFEWDFTSDFLGRDARGVPTDLRNNQWTLRLQGMF